MNVELRDGTAPGEPTEPAPTTTDAPTETATAAPAASDPAAISESDGATVVNVPAEPLLQAVKAALRACPRKEEDQPSTAYLVIASESKHSRLVIGGRDGRRWHVAFAPTSLPHEMRTLAITLESAKELRDALQYAADKMPGGANVRLRDTTGSDLLLQIRCGLVEPLTLELMERGSSKAPEGWRPPKFVAPAEGKAVASADYESRHMGEATRWTGGAIVKRDEVDAAGRRHITLVDDGGDELLHAVLVARGQTDGLPRDPQEEIPGALTPVDPAKAQKAKGKKAAKADGPPPGPVHSPDPQGYWRLERKVASGAWGTLERGTEEECRAVFERASSVHPLRLIAPDGMVAQYCDAAPSPLPKAGKVAAKPRKAKAEPSAAARAKTHGKTQKAAPKGKGRKR